MNVGPMGNGYITPIDEAYLAMLGKWVALHEEAIRTPRPTGISVEGKPEHFILKDGNAYYMFCFGLPMNSNPDVQRNAGVDYNCTFAFDRKIKSVTWLDNGKELSYTRDGGKVTIHTQPFFYGCHWVVRVAKIICE